MRIVPHVEAEEEIRAAFDYYEQAAPNLGRDFLDELQTGAGDIARRPETWPRIGRSGARRYLLRRFPFALIYATDDDEILLIAAMHLKRRPFYWRKRLGDSPFKK